MPNIKSAKKRVLVNKTRAARNKSRNTALKTAIKKAHAAVEANSPEANALVKEAIKKAVPGLSVLSQSPSMSQKERKEFLDAFSSDNKKALIGLCVLGGIYGEGVDLVGNRLIGSVIVGVGLPPPTNEREAMRAYFENRYEMGTAYAYAYPGLNRVLQAAGRVIRDEGDKGVIVLIDDRLSEPVYKEMLPSFWHTLAYAGNEMALAARLSRFWQK